MSIVGLVAMDHQRLCPCFGIDVGGRVVRVFVSVEALQRLADYVGTTRPDLVRVCEDNIGRLENIARRKLTLSGDEVMITEGDLTVP